MTHTKNSYSRTKKRIINNISSINILVIKMAIKVLQNNVWVQIQIG